MDGQDPNRRRWDDPAYTNHPPPFNAPRGNSFSASSGNRLSQRGSNPTPPVSRQDASSSLQLPFGASYYGSTSSTAGNNNILNQSHYDNPYAAGSSNQQSSQAYYGSVSYTTAASYQSTSQPVLSNNSSFLPNQPFSQRQFGQATPQPLGYNNDHIHHALYELDDPSPDPPLQLQQQLPSLPYNPTPQLPAYAAAPLQQLPPPPPPSNPARGFGGQEIMNTTLFEQGLDRVNTALPPIVTIIINHGDLNQARTMLMRVTEDLLSSVEEMQLTIDIPDHEVRGTQLWNDFNTAWLALFQAQYSRSYDLQQAGVSLNDTQLMTRDAIYGAITRIAHLARDYVEDRGLLDYEWGLWEADITTAADRCLELLKAAEEGDD